MPQLEKMPGFAQAAANALRGIVGMGPQQSAGPATNVQNGYREYAMQAMEQGQQPVPFEQWMQGQQMPVSSPR
jgi:hypothetical protein